MQIVLASGNQGKLAELAALLAELPVALRTQAEFGLGAAEESGTTFVENAIIKARQAAAATGLATIADDSGLVVPALDGAPGIHSARYAGAGASDEANVNRLLAALDGVPPPARRCCFVCVMVYLRHAADPLPLLATGLWQGRVLEAPRGAGGFGYDPLFLPAGETLSAAELPPLRKNALSHRGQAGAALARLLGAEFAQST
ncbi:MAG: RdgB/HAM1 family non-canonical purine NTP pyrophosphatase [Gammaproteobacteria bacterium]